MDSEQHNGPGNLSADTTSAQDTSSPAASSGNAEPSPAMQAGPTSHPETTRSTPPSAMKGEVPLGDGFGWLQSFFFRGIRPFLLIVLLASLLLAYVVLEPFLTQIILATVLAGLFAPVQEYLSEKLNGRRSLASLCVVVLICLVIILPLYFISSAMVKQGFDFTVKVREWVEVGGLDAYKTGEWIDEWQAWAASNIPFVDMNNFDIESNLLAIFRAISEGFLKQGAGVVGNVAGLLTNFLITMFLVFYLARDGRATVKKIKVLSPLREDQEDRIIARVKAISRSVLMGSLATAALQGLAGAIGFAIVGIPAVFWGVMLGFASFIPVVGTALIWVPATAYLLLLGDWQWALFLGLWSALVVGSIDNFVRPYLMKGEAEMSPFYIFLALLGGFQAYGIRGLLYGPLIMGFAMVMLLIYEEEFAVELTEPSCPGSEAAPAPSNERAAAG